MSNPPGKVTAILLAAGESRRMGELKALLSWQGLTLLEHQVAVLQEGGADQVIVVLGHRAEELRPLLEGRDRVGWVLNRNYLEGKTTSIKAGLLAVDRPSTGTIMFLNVDQPRTGRTIRRIVDAHQGGDALLTIPCCNGKGGHPILADASLLDEMLGIEEETRGMRAVTQRHRDRTMRLELGLEELLWDLNTPEQYRMAVEGSS